jgi:Family of unknown function (DUF6174)
MHRLSESLALCALALALSAAADAQSTDIQQHRERWRAAGIDDYRYAYRKYCECNPDEPPQTFVTVRDGRVVDVFHLHDDSDRRVPARSGSLDYYWTIEDLFDLLETATSRGAEVRMEFDARLGYPTRVYIDYLPDIVGDEVDVRVTELEADER